MSVITLLTICFILPSSFHPSLGAPDYTYYGVVPSKIFLYLLIDANNFTSGWVMGTNSSRTGSPSLNGKTLATKALLVIVAAENDTHVRVYDLADGSLLSEKTIDSMEKHLVLLANGTEFKVVSDKQVSVLLLNYQIMPAAGVTEGPLPYAFYTDVNGLYVGKEFLLMASEQTMYTNNKFYTIFALEKSSVTVTRDDGQQNGYSLDVNSYTTFMLETFRVYKIESTGNIMVQSSTYDVVDIAGGTGESHYRASYPVPCATGGFVGQFFVSKAIIGWDTNKDYGFRISASEDTNVKVFDLATKQMVNDLSVKGGTGVGFQPSADAIGVQSDKPITLSYINNGSLGTSRPAQYGLGVMFMGIQPDQNTPIYLPTEAYVEVYFFVNEETELTVDGFSQTIQPSQPKLLTLAGTHTVQADQNVIVQINFWPTEPVYQGLWFSGVAIPCIETVANNPTVALTPFGGGFPMTYVIAGAGAAAVVVIVVVLVMRRRGGKSS
jgi:hypothetical protein